MPARLADEVATQGRPGHIDPVLPVVLCVSYVGAGRKKAVTFPGRQVFVPSVELQLSVAWILLAYLCSATLRLEHLECSH